MAFVNQVLPDNFVNHKIKVLKVLCSECVQETGTVTIPVPGIPALEDIVSIDIVATGPPAIGTIEVLNGKIINVGTVPAALTITILGVELPITIPIPAIPFSGEVVCPGVVPDGTINVQKHDLQLEGLTATPIPLVEGVVDFGVLVTATIQTCVIISKETILKVNAATQFCPCP
jgi:hypothetical protein